VRIFRLGGAQGDIVLWFETVIAGALAAYQLVIAVMYSESAPQQAAGAAIAAATVIIPYCIARAWQRLLRASRSASQDSGTKIT
jgi:hypothetical protein